MPQVSDSTDEVKILSWRQSEGSAVQPGDVLAEIETDKVTLEIESAHSGTLIKIVAPAGESVRTGQLLAYVGSAGESVAAAPAARPVLADEDSEGTGDARSRVSPLARRLAREHNIDLATIRGSGPEGRIVRKDVEDAIAAGPRAASPQEQPCRPAPTAEASISGTLIPYTKMRATIAKRMHQSLSEAPHFHTTAVIAMDQAQVLRDALRKKPEFKGISVNHLIVKAAAYALAKEPRVNRAARGDQIYIPDHIGVGIVTAVEDGLLIPVIKNADKLSLAQLVAEARTVIDRAKNGKPGPCDLVGGTFTISNVGMYDVENFTAIISPGQGAILSVSSIQEQPVVRNGQIVIGQMMRVTLAVDHRVIDGVMSCIWLQHLKEALEMPALLLL